MGSDVSLSKAVRANLLSLQNTAGMMDKTQNRLATGNKVNSALDNPSSFFTASALNSRAADMSNLLNSMASGIKVIEAANNGITALTKNLESMQSTLRQARQDKSFQTKSFEVNDNTKINLGGGQFGIEDADISLATATVAGQKAQITTQATTAYLGPQSGTGTATGAGARSVISGLGGLGSNDVFTVAGRTVTLGAGAQTSATIKTAIEGALAGHASTAGKYTVSEGTGDNAGQIIIETVDTSAPAAAITFGAGSTAATKGSTTFNFSAITSSVTAGGQPIPTGATFEDFVANLEAGAEDGNYTVTKDATTKQITLTSTQWGGAAPTVTGVPVNAPADPGTPAQTEFTLGLYNDGGTRKVSADQDLTIAGATGLVSLTRGMTGADVKAALEADTNINSLYTVAVDATTLEVTLTEKANNGLAAPTVTSSKAAATPASLGGTGGVDYTTATDGDFSAFNGSVITLDDGNGNTSTYTFTNAAAGQAAALATALGTNGFTLTASATGLAISRADGKNFTIATTGGINGSMGLGTATTTTTNGVEAGLSGAPTLTPGDADVPAVDGQTITPAQAGASVATIAAEEATFTVSYGGKTAEISIGGVKGGVGSAVNALDIKNWQDATVAAVNADLEAAGIADVEAKFDADGKFQLIAKTAEAKTLAVSGADATALFGTNGVNTGVAEKSQLNATKTVDKFVELINRDHAGKVRASNDNGKLRIENLSTQDLDIGVDLNGNDAVTALKIDGNTVRANLSKQFNELRDQLDKLGDDASFNGINLLRGDKLKITFNESGTSSIDIQAKDANGNVRGINASNLGVDSLIAEDLDTDEKIDAFLTKLSSALTELRSQASAFGSNLSSVENRQSFTKNMINTLETGAANLTLADTNEEAANLLALQTRQQLSSSALSMASQQDQAVLQLLR
ncbi:flagellin N-terminal helical domain-containing protein [Devosia riboflavina]